MKKIKVLFYADEFDGTSGYSIVGKELATRLAKDDRFEVFFQQLINPTPVTKKEGVTIFPAFVERDKELFIYNILNNIRIINPDVFIPISDIFLMRRDGINQLLFNNIKFMPYVLIDSENVPDYNEEILKYAHKIFTASKHGQKELSKEGYESELLYHGVSENFKEVDKVTKYKLRKEYNIKPKDKVFLFIGRNFLRKRPMRLIEAISLFNKKLKDDNKENNSKFLLHISDADNDAWNLELFVKRMEKLYNVDNSNIIFTKKHKLGKGLNKQDLIKLYQLSDVYITASAGEGAGLPLLEAMKCKLPIIAPDNTTHSDLLKDGMGYLVKNYGISYVGYGCYHKLIDIIDLKDKIHYVYNTFDSDEMKSYKNKAFSWAKENADWNKITKQLADTIINEVN
jgi:glycosyltransferase involved in cell wall biosynthesis